MSCNTVPSSEKNNSTYVPANINEETKEVKTGVYCTITEDEINDLEHKNKAINEDDFDKYFQWFSDKQKDLFVFEKSDEQKDLEEKDNIFDRLKNKFILINAFKENINKTKTLLELFNDGQEIEKLIDFLNHRIAYDAKNRKNPLLRMIEKLGRESTTKETILSCSTDKITYNLDIHISKMY